MRYQFIKLVIVLILALNFTNCARRGNPTGGAIDSIPPVVVKTDPELNKTNFKAEKIKIYFDEYIKINDLKKNLIISPPQKNEPIIYPVGSASKYISIKILDTLEPNTTYLYNFGNSIVDNNEGNELGNFKYVFSTGNHIDSLTLNGKVVDNTTKEPTKGIDVMLYKYDSTYTDSIIYKEKPRYITNTLDTTLYELTNLKAGNYKLIALDDKNSNKIYDPETDKIGFIEKPVSIPTDTTYEFTIFKEVPEFKIVKATVLKNGHIIFGFEGNPKDVNIELASAKPINFKQVINFEKDKDTINYWYTPFETDSLIFKTSAYNFEKEFVVKTRNKEIDSLKVITNVSKNLHLNDTLKLVTNTPIVSFDTNKITLTKKIDSIFEVVNFEPILSKSKNELYINFQKEYNSTYSFTALPKSITDIYTTTNDSISTTFKILEPEAYGTLIINVSSTLNENFIIEIIDKNAKIVGKQSILKTESAIFKNLLPGIYYTRIIVDSNKNGKWDTGNFLKTIQPEVIRFNTKEIDLRANWEVSETFTIN